MSSSPLCRTPIISIEKWLIEMSRKDSTISDRNLLRRFSTKVVNVSTQNLLAHYHLLFAVSPHGMSNAACCLPNAMVKKAVCVQIINCPKHG